MNNSDAPIRERLSRPLRGLRAALWCRAAKSPYPTIV